MTFKVNESVHKALTLVTPFGIDKGYNRDAPHRHARACAIICIKTNNPHKAMKIKDTVERTRQGDTQHSLSTTSYLYCFIDHTHCHRAPKHCDRESFIII